MNFNGNLRIAQCDENGIVTGPWLGLLNPVKCELVTPAAENVDEISRLIDFPHRSQVESGSSLMLCFTSKR